MLIIGERINASRKTIFEAISSKDKDLIKKETQIQADAGAHYIDVNAGTFVTEEEDRLKWLIEIVQNVTNLPLSVDSPNPRVIKSALPLLKNPPIINSITLEPSRLEGILPLVVEKKAKVIGLCQSKDSMAETIEAKVEFARQLVEKVREAEIPLDDLYIDPLVYPIATKPASATATLGAIEIIREQFPGVHATCGLTNVSHGFPYRKLINRTFLVAAILKGLDSAILDPTDNDLYGALRAALLVAGKDDFGSDYIAAYRERRFG